MPLVKNIQGSTLTENLNEELLYQNQWETTLLMTGKESPAGYKENQDNTLNGKANGYNPPKIPCQ